MLISCTAAQVEEASRSRHWTFAICRHSFAEGIFRSWRSLGPISRYFHGKQEIIYTLCPLFLWRSPILLYWTTWSTMYARYTIWRRYRFSYSFILTVYLFVYRRCFTYFFITWITFRAGTTGLLHDVIDSKRDVLLSENVEPTDEDRRSSRLFQRCLSG